MKKVLAFIRILVYTVCGESPQEKRNQNKKGNKRQWLTHVRGSSVG